MKDEDLRHLRRADLLSLLQQLSAENDRLRQELEDAKAQAARQQVRIAQCGSLAEAALQLSGVFEAADAAAQKYLELVKQNAGVTPVQDVPSAAEASTPEEGER